jgi:uncharacterized protein YutE (UPF0331/DUF86 family)
MQNDILIRKLDSLRRCLKRLEEKNPEDWKGIEDDYDLQDIISINLERAVQISVDIGLQLLSRGDHKPPNTMAEVFSLLAREGIINDGLASNLRSAVGFRNISVHEYESIDWKIVSSILDNNLVDFYLFIETVLRDVS